MVELQFELMTQKDQSRPKYIIWFPQKFDGIHIVKDHLLNRIATIDEEAADHEIIEDNIEVMKEIMIESLKSMEEKKRDDVKSVQNGLDNIEEHTVYIIHDQEDEAEVDSLVSLLAPTGLQILTSSFNEYPGLARTNHFNKLIRAEIVFIYCNRGDKAWQFQKFNDLEMVKGYGKQEPFKHIGVIVAGEETPEKAMLIKENSLTLDMTTGINVDLIINQLAQMNLLHDQLTASY